MGGRRMEERCTEEEKGVVWLWWRPKAKKTCNGKAKEENGK
jgi:hypothetical protein